MIAALAFQICVTAALMSGFFVLAIWIWNENLEAAIAWADRHPILNKGFAVLPCAAIVAAFVAAVAWVWGL